MDVTGLSKTAVDFENFSWAWLEGHALRNRQGGVSEVEAGPSFAFFARVWAFPYAANMVCSSRCPDIRQLTVLLLLREQDSSYD